MKENNNENINNYNDNDHKNLIENKMANVILENSSTLLSDLKNIYVSNLTKTEYVFNSLNSSIMTNFYL